MEKIYVGQLHMAHRVSNADVTEKTELRAANKNLRAENETLKKALCLFLQI